MVSLHSLVLRILLQTKDILNLSDRDLLNIWIIEVVPAVVIFSCLRSILFKVFDICTVMSTMCSSWVNHNSIQFINEWATLKILLFKQYILFKNVILHLTDCKFWFTLWLFWILSVILLCMRIAIHFAIMPIYTIYFCFSKKVSILCRMTFRGWSILFTERFL